jgi:acetyl/propionyl-CoA carboxylase alpha subunit
MLQALADYRVVGVSNNIGFLSRLVACPAFAQADLDTGLIERERAFLFPETHGAAGRGLAGRRAGRADARPPVRGGRGRRPAATRIRPGMRATAGA